MKTRIVLTAEFPDGERPGFVVDTTKIIKARVDEIAAHLNHNAKTLELGLKFSVEAQKEVEGPYDLKWVPYV